jgi:hypothetical protein
MDCVLTSASGASLAPVILKYIRAKCAYAAGGDVLAPSIPAIGFVLNVTVLFLAHATRILTGYVHMHVHAI